MVIRRALLIAVVAAAGTGGARLADARVVERPRAPVMLVDGGQHDGAPLVLERHEMRADILAFTGRVRVQQAFRNPVSQPVEAVYVFPLPADAAVSSLIVRSGERVITGKVMARDDAVALYQRARAAGDTAALLEQERPNIFTQSVTGVQPGATVTVELIYDTDIPFADGAYEFVYPMVVGPRTIPGTPLDRPQTGLGRAHDTDAVPDASRITPPLRRPGSRSGHGVGAEVLVDAGVPIAGITSPTHAIVTEAAREVSRTAMRVRLADGETVPDKDFVIRYRIAADAPPVVALHHRSEDGAGYLALVHHPPDAGEVRAGPRGLVLLIDDTGAMAGEPLGMAKRIARAVLRRLEPTDRFRVALMSGAAMSQAPLPATTGNVRAALRFVNAIEPVGAIDLAPAMRAMLGTAEEPRFVCLLTDGYAGNDRAVIAAVREHIGLDRLLAVGVGSAVNRALLDRMARAGRGDALVALLDEPADRVADRLLRRVDGRVLTDVRLSWAGIDVRDQAPAVVPDILADRPITVAARWTGGTRGSVRIDARDGQRERTWKAAVALSAGDRGEAIARLWARARIRELRAAQGPGEDPARAAEIARLALAHGLASPYTALVAIEGADRGGGTLRSIHLPVEVPEGVTFGAVVESRDVRQQYTVDGAARSDSGEALVMMSRGERWRGPSLAVSGGIDLDGGPVARLALGYHARFGAARLGAATSLLVGAADHPALVSALLEVGVTLPLIPVELAGGGGAALGLSGDGGLAWSAALRYWIPTFWRASPAVEVRLDGVSRGDAADTTTIGVGLGMSF